MHKMLAPYYVVPALLAFIYGLMALCMKKALDNGCGVLRMGMVSHFTAAFMFAPLVFLAREQPAWELWFWPVIAGTLGFAGMALFYTAIRMGDVSVQAPVMGLKVIFVAFITIIMGAGPVPLTWWAGAFMAAGGVTVIGWSNPKTRPPRTNALALGVISAAVLALCDVVVQKYGGRFGPRHFVMGLLATTALWSFLFIPFLRNGFRDMPPATWKWVLPAAVIMGLQGCGIGLILSIYGRATAVNIIYTSRGLWSILAVWWLGRYLGIAESGFGWRIMARRLLGAALLMASILLVLLEE